MKSVQTSGKRKDAIARAVIKPGKGTVRINHMALEVYEPKMARLKISEPLLIAGDYAGKVDIQVNVRGGGIMGQAEAARLAIARGLVQFTKDKNMEKEFLIYDRHLLVADVRQRESRKPNTHGNARGKVQKSYR